MNLIIRIKTVILLWILLSGVSGIQAQSPGDIDTLSQWRVSVLSFDGYEFVTYEFKYFISGTVTTDSNEYYKVYRSGYSYVNPSEPNYFYDVYSGALREQENKWYALNYLNDDVLLYDFTMQLGDTVESMTTLGATLTVIAIDTTMVDGEPKKRFYLDYGGFGNEETYILEDVGASSGLFEAIIFFEVESALYCYAIDYVPLWLNPDSPYCDLSVSIEENENISNTSIYPNPFSTSTTIEFELDGKSNIQITVYNSIGETVYQLEDHFEQGSHKVSWAPGHLPEGLYFAVLKSEDGVTVSKMLKQ